MKLFVYEGYKLEISPEAFAIKAFRDLVKRDKSVDKYKAMLELAYIYFMFDPRSDYSYVVEEEERHVLIVKQEGLPDGWTPDDKVKAAIEVYKTLTKTSYSELLKGLRVAIDKTKKFFEDMNLADTDDKGRPKYTINTIVAAAKNIPSLIKEVSAAEKLIVQEIEESGKMRANKSKKVLEDGFDNFITDDE